MRFATPNALDVAAEPALLDDVRAMIEAARRDASRAVNSAMVLAYWSIGERIRREVLGADRAEYGRQVVDGVAAHLLRELEARLQTVVATARQKAADDDPAESDRAVPALRIAPG